MGLDQTEKRSSKTNSTGCSIPPLIKSRRRRATGLISLKLFPVLQEQCRRLDSNQRSSESESDALSSYATPTNHPNGLAYSNASLKQSQSPPPFVPDPANSFSRLCRKLVRQEIQYHRCPTGISAPASSKEQRPEYLCNSVMDRCRLKYPGK